MLSSFDVKLASGDSRVEVTVRQDQRNGMWNAESLELTDGVAAA